MLEAVLDSWPVVELDVSTGAELDDGLVSAAVDELEGSALDEAETDSSLVVELDVSTGAELDDGAEVDEAEADSVLEALSDS